jgi:hypothetical protein
MLLLFIAAGCVTIKLNIDSVDERDKDLKKAKDSEVEVDPNTTVNYKSKTEKVDTTKHK